MALRDNGNGVTVDPVDADALATWTQRRAGAQHALDDANRELAVLNARLALPDVADARRERDLAEQELAAAHAAAEVAQERFDTADAAALRYEAVDLADATAALDAATLVLSQALAELLRDASTSAALTATVDGLALRERYAAATAVDPPAWNHTTIPFPAGAADVVDPELALPIADGPDGEYRRLLAVLGQLDDRVDAVADLVTAESVHQLVQGNPTRAGGSLGVAAAGRVPDEFDVISTPRAGYDVAHRVLVLTDPARLPAWIVARAGPAATLDPVTAAWLSGLLPDPARAGVRLRLTDAGGTDLADPVDVRLSDLGLDPFGWARVAAAPAELDCRLALVAAARRADGAVPPEGARLHWDADEPVDAGGVSLADLLAAAAALGRLLGLARALDPADLAHPAVAGPPPPGADAAATVADRIAAVEARIDALAADLDAAAAGTDAAPATADLGALIGLLLDAAAAGVAEGVPPLGTPPADPRSAGAAGLAALARAAAARLRGRHAVTPFRADPGDPAGTLVRARARAAELAGVRLPVPAVLPPPAAPAMVTDLTAGGSRLSGADPTAVRVWLADHAPVRPAVRAALAAYDLAETLGATEALDLRATQVPLRDGDTWVGATARPPVGTTALVVQASYGQSVPAGVAGLVLDAWTQPVPADRHETGVAFHYDQPSASPPQALLVAVHPDPAAEPAVPGWDLDTLLDVVASTFALAQDRAAAAERHDRRGVEVPDA